MCVYLQFKRKEKTMDPLPNRLTGKRVLPPGAFFFEYDYWVEVDGEIKSVTDDSPMPPRTLKRYQTP